MTIETGLFSHMVLQRNGKDQSDQAITGTASIGGPVTVRVSKGGRTLPGFNRKTIGSVGRGKFSAVLKGVPVGGPYDIELTVGQETTKITDVLVGDVWIAAGQSNMQGAGRRHNADKPHPMARAFYMDDAWRIARDPIHNMWACVDQVHIDLSGGVRPGEWKEGGVGPAVSFAQEMHRLSGIPQGVIACAHGGTSMALWDPRLKHLGGKSLYGASIRRLQKNGGKVAGVIWYQGESDASDALAAQYTANMKRLIAAFRRDCGDKRLPMALVQIGRVVAWESARAWNSIQEQQRKLPELIDNVAVVPAIDLPLEDFIHIGGEGTTRLGRRLAGAMAALTGVTRMAPIALKRVSTEADPVSKLMNVVIEFANVDGALHGSSRAMGFEVIDASAPATGRGYHTELKGNKAIIRTSVMLNEATPVLLHYGLGINPPCNIVDAAGRSLPVFGPVRLNPARALTPWVLQFDVSAVQPSAGKLEDLPYPVQPEKLSFRPRQFLPNLASVHDLFTPGEDVLVYYRLRFSAPEKMKLAALVGYDGPVKLWIDRKEVLHDPNGTNPAVYDARRIPFAVTAGDHEVMVALSSNKGRAWGIFLRFERMDVKKAAIVKGPEHYTLPELLPPAACCKASGCKC